MKWQLYETSKALSKGNTYLFRLIDLDGSIYYLTGEVYDHEEGLCTGGLYDEHFTLEGCTHYLKIIEPK